MKNIIKPLWQHALVLLGFIVISFIYFSPVINGKELPQMDMSHAKGMANELIQFEKANKGETSLWTNSMFSGMPAYQIKGGNDYSIFRPIKQLIHLGLPYTTVCIMFLLFAGFYFLLSVVGFNKWLAIAGAFAFGLATYNPIIIAAGHITKAYAIAYIPLVMAGFITVFNGRYLLGAFFLTLFTGLQISYNHPQITYYTLLVAMVMVIVKSIYAIKERQIKHIILSSAIAAGSLALAVLPNITGLLTTSEYSKYTIRGKSELSSIVNQSNASTGLDKDYALAWSYGKAESFTLLIPNFMGGGANGFDSKSETAATLQSLGVQSANQVASSLPAYWGDMPFTSGPVYFGAIICFLFILGLFVVKGAEKWWLLGATILSLFLAWGRNFMWFTDLFFYYFPMYNKFRTVSMILVVTNFTMLYLGFLALKEIFEEKITKQELIKYLKYSGAIVGGLLAIFMIMPGIFFEFSSSSDQQLIGQLKSMQWPQDAINKLMDAIMSDRSSMLKADAFRSFVFFALAFTLIISFVYKKIKPLYLSIGLMLLILIDMWGIARRYLNNDNFVDKKQHSNEFAITPADQFILQDNDPNYRVLNLARNTFNDGITPYYHKCIGGYHGAKLRRYQDLIDNQLSDDIQMLRSTMSKQVTVDALDASLAQANVLNMLNAKYIIYSMEAQPLINSHAYGNAWFVNKYNLVSTADDELKGLTGIDLRNTAIINKKFETQVSKISSNIQNSDTSSYIKLLTYKPNQLVYESNNNVDQIAVFSEVYYEKGWKASIDGKSIDHYSANWILRALTIPAGKHTIEFKFEPQSYNLGKQISLYASIGVLLLLVFVVVVEVKRLKE